MQSLIFAAQNGDCKGAEWVQSVDLVPADVLTDIASCNLRNVAWVIRRVRIRSSVRQYRRWTVMGGLDRQCHRHQQVQECGQEQLLDSTRFLVTWEIGVVGTTTSARIPAYLKAASQFVFASLSSFGLYAKDTSATAMILQHVRFGRSNFGIAKARNICGFRSTKWNFWRFVVVPTTQSSQVTRIAVESNSCSCPHSCTCWCLWH